MQPASQSAPVSRTSLWAGRVLSALVLLLIGFTAMFGVLKPDVAMPLINP
jgi:ABC-type Na+ efflux pump permease subunit